ncbi:hypothetical protein Pfo_003501 [Paulownia fortunei]|nr:hypothetical protein Pfo_003501 [Paulownia fortunei]
MADARENIEINKALCDCAIPMVIDTFSGIRPPIIQANNFEIKSAIIQMIQANQLCVLANEDPNAHIASFLEICDTFKYNGVTNDAIRLRLFHFSLRDKAKIWLNSLHAGTITTWARLAQSFLAKFFPLAKTTKMQNDIMTFAQYDLEYVHEAWEKYKDLLRRCPHHGLPNWLQVQTFYNGLSGSTRTLVDVAAGGALMGKTHEEAYDLLETMAGNAYQWPSERIIPKKVFGVHDVDALATLTAQVAVQNNPYSTMYNQGWRNHPNFLWINGQNAVGAQPSSFQPPNQFQQLPKTSLEDASVRNLEVQIDQIANMLSTRSQGSFSSNIEINPKKNVHAITLRSGKKLLELERKFINPKKPVIESAVEESNETPSKKVEKLKLKLFSDNPFPYVSPIIFP